MSFRGIPRLFDEFDKFAAAIESAVSDGMKVDILAAYPEIPAERIRVIRNGIDTTEYHPDPNTDVLERYGIVTREQVLAFIQSSDAPAGTQVPAPPRCVIAR